MCKCCQAVDVVALHLLRANPGERRKRETLGKDNVRDNGFSVVGWTFSAREAILH